MKFFIEFREAGASDVFGVGKSTVEVTEYFKRSFAFSLATRLLDEIVE